LGGARLNIPTDPYETGFVGKFARSSGLGRNGALESFLRLGLVSYLHGKITLLKAIRATAEKMNACTPG